MPVEIHINALTERAIGACIEVHRNLGPGLLESVYQRCVVHELREAGVACAEEAPVPLWYKNLPLGHAFRLDLLVDGRLILELKAVEQLLPIHHAQLVSYLRLAKMPVGLLVNFHALRLRDQLKRVVNPACAVPRVSEGDR